MAPSLSARISPLLPVFAVCSLLMLAPPAYSKPVPFASIDALVDNLVKQITTCKAVKGLNGGLIAVAPFVTNDPTLNDTALPYLQQKLAGALVKGDQEHFQVLDPSILQQGMTRLNLDADKLANPQNWSALATATGMEYLLVGSAMSDDTDNPTNVAFLARVVELPGGYALAAGDGAIKLTPDNQPPKKKTDKGANP